jgi:hypothetical protein
MAGLNYYCQPAKMEVGSWTLYLRTRASKSWNQTIEKKVLAYLIPGCIFLLFDARISPWSPVYGLADISKCPSTRKTRCRYTKQGRRIRTTKPINERQR